MRQLAFGTFDNFNTAVSGVKGNVAEGTELFIETLMTPALDEVSTEYGLLAEAVSFPDDFSAVTYRLRAQARWHDGKPITPDDVLYSFDVLKKNSPFYGAYYRHVVKAEKGGEREIRFSFDSPGNRELPQILGQLPVLPKHWWEGTDKSGQKRDVTQTTLEPPLGSGPYRLKEFAPGRTLVYEKVDNYWGKDLNVIIGTRNFQTIRYEYFRDSTVALEAFKADQADWRVENSAKEWATAYDFPAVREKRVVTEEFPIRNVGVMQAFAFNVRREKFKDLRVRRAFNFAFDFEEMNRQIFFGQYRRIASYFEGTELASSSIPEGMELEILQTVRDKVPADLFTQPYTNPVGGNPQNVRNNTREALALLRSAGYEVRNTKLVGVSNGEPLHVELLVEQPAFERIMLFYKPSLERLGIDDSGDVGREPGVEPCRDARCQILAERGCGDEDRLEALLLDDVGSRGGVNACLQHERCDPAPPVESGPCAVCVSLLFPQLQIDAADELAAEHRVHHQQRWIVRRIAPCGQLSDPQLRLRGAVTRDHGELRRCPCRWRDVGCRRFRLRIGRLRPAAERLPGQIHESVMTERAHHHERRRLRLGHDLRQKRAGSRRLRPDFPPRRRGQPNAIL